MATKPDNNLDKTVQEVWKKEKVRFNHPQINGPIVVDSLEGQDSASFDWIDRKIRISEGFVADITKYMPMQPAVEAILRHETGHWMFFPRELSDKLYLMAEAHKIFKEKAEPIYMFYSDLANEGSVIHWGLGGEELLQMREVFAKQAEQKEGKDGASVIINNLMRAKYVHTFKDSFKQIDLTPKQKEYFEKVKDIPYIELSLDEHLASLYRFGKAIEDLIIPQKIILICKHGTVGGIPITELDGGLSGILQKKGVRAYRVVKQFLKEVRPDFDDSFGDDGPKGAGVGTGHKDFKRHDEQISLYKRWAANHGVYIVKKPVEADSTALYRSGKKEYEIGDPTHKIDIFGSRGQIALPGVTKVHQDEEGKLPAIQWSIPHLNLGIDSSASMTNPADLRGAIQVLCAFVMGANYHKNGAMVGGWNFSEDIAFLPPSRELDAYYSLMCGFWGGGTHLNIDKLKKFVETSELGRKTGIQFSTEKDYQHMLDRMSEEDKKKVMDKSLVLDMSKLKAKYAKLDNVIITDGFIANNEQVINYLNGLGQTTRNFVFITDKNGVKDWARASKLPNTWIYLAEKPADLLSLALGRTKALQAEAKSNYLGVPR